MHLSAQIRHTRKAMTLIELLIVMFILLLFVAIAAPLLRPQTESTKVREAARQVGAFFEQAKAVSAQTNRTAGVLLDRRSAVREGARDSNIITRLYITESPPPYFGDTTGARVAIWLDPVQAPIPGFTQGPVMQGGPTGIPHYPRIISLDYGMDSIDDDMFPAQNAMLDAIAMSYFSDPPAPGDMFPFTVRLGGQGRRHPALAYATGTPGLPPGFLGRPIQYICISEYGDSLYNAPLPTRPATYTHSVPDPNSRPYVLRQYETIFPPQITTNSPLELPTGTAIDLQYSGSGASGWQFFDSTRIGTSQVSFLFGADGKLASVQRDKLLEFPNGRIHLLIGSTKRAIDTIDTTTPANRSTVGSNLDNPEGFWISISSSTGHISTSQNVSLINPPDFATAINQARSFATGLNTKGGF